MYPWGMGIIQGKSMAEETKMYAAKILIKYKKNIRSQKDILNT